MIALALKAARAAHGGNAAKLATGKRYGLRSRDRRVADVVVNIAGDEEVEAAIAVIVTKSCAGRPVTQSDSGLLGNVGKRAVVIVAIQAVLAEVADEDVRPAVVVVISDGYAKTPAVIRHSGFVGDICKCAVVVVMEEGCVRRFGFALFGLIGRAVHKVNVEPAIVVIVDKADTGAVCLNDELLVRNPHLMTPCCQAGLLADVLKDHRAAVYKSSSGYGTVFGVVHRRMNAAGAVAAHGSLLGWWRLSPCGQRCEGEHKQEGRKDALPPGEGALISTTGHGLNIADSEGYSSPDELVSLRINSVSRSRYGLPSG